MKNDNDKKIAEYQRKKFLKWGIIALYLCVIVLEILALLNIIDMLWGCIVFLLIFIIKKIFLK